MPNSAQSIDALASIKQVRRGDALYEHAPSRWSPTGLAGRLVEITGAGATAALTAAMGLVREAQRQGETTAWIAPEESLFFPPDVAEGGVDLAALVIVRVPLPWVMTAADKLARSGAFGLIVLDLCRGDPLAHRGGKGPARRGDGWLSRLLGLARKHNTAMLFLTRGTAPLGTLVSLRGETRRVRLSQDRYQVRVQMVKDKRRAPNWRHQEQCRGPAGMC